MLSIFVSYLIVIILHDLGHIQVTHSFLETELSVEGKGIIIIQVRKMIPQDAKLNNTNIAMWNTMLF